MNTYSPIALFVYNRLQHTKKVIEAIKKNHISQRSTIYVFSDFSDVEFEKNKIKKIRNYLNNLNGFKKIIIVQRKYNLGTSNNIVLGLNQIFKKHDKCIIIEDDIIISKNFLYQMNYFLEKFNKITNIASIEGYMYPVKFKKSIPDYFFLKGTGCWGWATWKDRWSHFEKNSEKLINEFTEEDIKNFNLDNTESFWSQVIDNHSGRINTWAIFWYATIFKNKGLCMNPFYSYVKNIGFDGSGTHKNFNKIFQDSQVLNNYGEFKPQINTEENLLAVEKIRKYYLDNTNNFKKFIKLLIAFLFGKKLLRRLEALWRKIVN